VSGNRPTDAELARAARNELAALGTDSANAAYRLRLVAGALAIVERALAEGAEAADSERAALSALLLGGGDGLDALRTRLCQALREGELSPDDPAVLRALRAMAEAHLRIDNPELKALPVKR
jgi:hypothetical protein